MTAAALWRRLVGYFDGANRDLRLAGTVAFVVVGNQPFYPLYIWWVAGSALAWLSFATWFSTPFFAAVPAVGRRSEPAGKTLLIAAGLINTAICAILFGPTSGVELFYLPCLLLAFVLFEARAAWLAFAASAALVAAAMIFARRVASEAVLPMDSDALIKLHAFSVAGLLAVIVYRLWAERRVS